MRTHAGVPLELNPIECFKDYLTLFVRAPDIDFAMH